MRASEFITEDDYYPSSDDNSKSAEELDAFVQAYVDDQLGAPHKHSIKQDMSVIIAIPQSKKRRIHNAGQRWDYEGQKEEWQETAMDLIDELNRAEFGEYEIAHMSASYIELYKPNLNETTVAGGIATVVSGMGSTLTRNASIYGTTKKKKKKVKETSKYMNSITKDSK